MKALCEMGPVKPYPLLRGLADPDFDAVTELFFLEHFNFKRWEEMSYDL